MNSLSGNSAPTIGRPSRVRPIEAADAVVDDGDEVEGEVLLAAARVTLRLRKCLLFTLSPSAQW